jgi:RNA polymerase sigma-70 factor (ECF subfamily)
MAESATSGEISLIHYREYLLLLARVRFDPRLQGQLDPSDIVQEALLKAHRALGQFRGETEQQLAAWLRTILTNTLANAIRDHGRRHEVPQVSLDRALDGSSTRLEVALATGQLSPEQVVSHNEELLRLGRAINRLPDEQRLVMEMKHLQGYSLAEICERTGRSKPSVVGLLHRGMKALRKLLDDQDSEASSPDPTRLP